MPGTWFGIEIARRSLNAHQNTLDVTGHNLANASTPGYSRQEAVLKGTAPYTVPSLGSPTVGQIGSGVEVGGIRRIKDEYLEHQVRRAVTDTSYWEDQITVLQRAEASFAEPTASGIGDRIVDFFKAWQDLNNSPQDPGVKASVVQIGDELASLLSYTYNQLTDVQDSVAAIVSDTTTSPPTYDVIDGQLKQQVGQVNDLLVKIHNLTDAIERLYCFDQQPNDLLDQREVLLEELSKFGPLQVEFATVAGKPTGGLKKLTFLGIDVSVAGAATFKLTTNGSNIVLTDGNNDVDLTSSCNNTNQGGSLLGLERARQTLISFKSQLYGLADSMKEKIKAVNLEPPQAGHKDFFTGALDTGDFRVDGNLLNNPTLLDGTKAKGISALRGENIDSNKPYTFEECYSLLLTEVGGSARSTGDMARNQSAISRQISALRDSVSGVSVDEELTKMLQFQYGYMASARMTSVLDNMLDVLINRLF